MIGDVHRKRLLATALAVAIVAVLNAFGLPQFLPGQAAAYTVLLVFPGLGLYLVLVGRRWGPDLALGAFLVSPLMTGAAATTLLLTGLSADVAARVLTLLWAVFTVAALWFSRRPALPGAPRRSPRTLLLVSTIVLFCAAAGYLPLTHQWWRQWADAWFHGAVVAQIDHFGIPPEDPYFAGMPLQYMWFYHVVTITLAKAMRIDPFMVMPLLNLQAMTGLALGAYLLGRRLRKGYAFGYFALLTVLLALNAGVWLFFPLKLFRSLIGDTRGWEEVARNFRLVPFEKETATAWVTVLSNQTFLLNKFIVSTAFSLGLCYMGALWYAVVRYLDQPDRVGQVFIFTAVSGMLLFHPLVGFVMLAIGAVVLVSLWLVRRHLIDYSGRRLARVALTTVFALVATAPYLYSVTHAKESKHLFPLSLSLQKSAGIAISCGLVIILASFQVRRVASERSMSSYTLLFGAACAFVLCNILQLPGPNTYDKLPFFVFYPLAIMGSWTFAERFARPHATCRFRRRVAFVALILLLPVNVLMTAAYYRTSPKREITAEESRVAAWVSSETPREALFLDSGDRVFLLVAGPRRYYWGRESYAEQWGYPREEMATRRRVRDNLFSSHPITNTSLQAIGRLENELYVVARDDEPATGGSGRFTAYPGVFREVYRQGAIVIFEVNRQACLELAGAAQEKEGA